MKQTIFLIVFIFSVSVAKSQNLIINWQQVLGGSSLEDKGFSCRTSDGGYAIIGKTQSTDGDVTFNHGLTDVWVVRLNQYGAVMWQHSYGGSYQESCISIQQTSDGGFIVASTSDSDDGDVTTHYGDQDFWIFKIDSNGFIQWQKTYGGSDEDQANDVALATDGGYLIGGFTKSNDYNVSGNHGNVDFWVIKLSSNGALEWQKCYGGTSNDYLRSVTNTNDGGYLLSGLTWSNNGDVSGNHGVIPFGDAWLLKIDIAGNIQWQKCRGGSDDDDARDVEQTPDGGYIVAGYTNSNDYDVSGHHGEGDVWVFKTNSTGDILWQKCLGGTERDGWYQGYDLEQSIYGGYIIAAMTKSNDFDVIGNHGSEDAWIVALGENGELKWQYCFGGTGEDRVFAIHQLPNGNYIVSGISNSVNGDLSENHGSWDYWIFEFKESAFIRGKCYVDYNQNGIEDSTDVPFNNLMVVSSGNGFSFSSQPDSAGRYYNFSDTGNVETTLNNLEYYTSTPVVGYSQLPSYNQEDTIDFALIPIPGITDMSITGIPLGPARLNSDVDYRLIVSNNGTDTVNGKVFLVFHPNLEFTGASFPYDTLILDTLMWSFQNLKPLQYLNIDVTFFVPVFMFEIGDTLTFDVWVDPDSIDVNLPDNSAPIFHVITGAIDPNNKITAEAPLLPLDFVLEGNSLTYIINFQNTGTDTAFKVIVKDTLDNSLDGNSFKMVQSSHNYDLSIDSLHYITWTFKNILLPDSNTNEELSHGFICFKIKPQSFTGTTILNNASIYFDYNLPVITNTCSTQFYVQTVAGNATSLESALQIFPNPSHEIFFISYPDYYTYRVVDVLGNEMIHGNSQYQTNIACSDWIAGIYFVIMQSGGLLVIRKIFID